VHSPSPPGEYVPGLHGVAMPVPRGHEVPEGQDLQPVASDVAPAIAPCHPGGQPTGSTSSPPGHQEPIGQTSQ